MREPDNSKITQYTNDCAECLRYEAALLLINAAYQRLYVKKNALHLAVTNLRLEADNLRLEADNLRLEADNLRLEADNLRNEISFLSNTRSWRLTKPLRFVSRLIRKFNLL